MVSKIEMDEINMMTQLCMKHNWETIPKYNAYLARLNAEEKNNVACPYDEETRAYAAIFTAVRNHTFSCKLDFIISDKLAETLKKKGFKIRRILNEKFKHRNVTHIKF